MRWRLAVRRRLKTLLVLTARLIRPLGGVIGRLGSSLKQDAAVWERQYAGGHWAYFWSVEELARYSVITGYVASLKPQGAVLDVGCGEGALYRLMLKPHCSRYFGIDLAREAILRAAQHEDATTTFRTADAATFTTDETFDVIIFNETLYYFDDPASLLTRYVSMLKPDGIFVLSAVSFPHSLRVWRAVDRVLTIRDEVVVYHHRQGLSWVVQAATVQAQG
jgi:2-polyprenyl-3-methyl-5-hydroxy-6-metoxy-1,4-benzoquinol methylase